ncbi:peptidyl-alpha-hydroxyglycine alpha-amidating lyase family protein [Winogradskyella jejuensis]|uniref:peptidylamidoglycolate lyase n=1 Tax=Winogradskyella jejuensis TaxID=1089305 RepID=A0A1M5VXT8_9FLAO|nr:peptidyl-alpha-hydroxyglycine alpha-amidating lyase family protein [Winogradskyella jejuensis]SHH80008.1 peptidylamidoglycolate lyase [Winogradskyella jejuensis]
MKLIKNISILLLITISILSCKDSEKNISEEVYNNSDVYTLDIDWPNLPNDFNLGTPAGLGLNSKGNIIVFHRSSRVWETNPISHLPVIEENTISEIDSKSGEILKSWGKDLFVMPHGLEVDSQDNIWVTDCGLHQVFKFDASGNLLMTLGEARVSGNDSEHFNLPTDIAITPDGSFYVSDGYGNSRVVKFSKDGDYLFEWGKLGNEKGEFRIPHGIDLDNEGNVYVADRENNRIQKFDSKGNFIKLWQNQVTDQLYSVTIDNHNNHLFGIDYFIVDNNVVKGSDIFRFDLDANLQVQFGRSGHYEGSTTRYHDIQIDNEGSIYVGDILGNRIQKFKLKE